MKCVLGKILLIGIFFTDLSFPQWSTDPNNNLIVGYGLDPKISSDSAGGCYITYDYENLSYPRKLALERIDKYGYKPWGDKKQILGELPGQSEAEIIEDGLGGVIVSYEDRKDDVSKWTAIIRLQRVDSSGNFLWGLTGVKITLEEVNQGLQQLVTDGEGGCVITWVNNPFTYYMNRIDKDGNRMWGDSGVVLGTSDFDSHPRIVRAADGNYYVETGEYIYRIRQNGEVVRRDSVTLGYIVPDPEGGIVLSGRVWTGMIPKLVAQRKDSLGNNLWQEPYVEMADSLDIGTSLNNISSNNYYHYGWLGRKNGTNEILQIQSLRNDGTKLFFGGSIPISESSTSVTSVPIIPSYNGSNIYAWTHWDSPQTYNANFARRIDTTGTDLWQSNPVLLNEPYLGYFSMTTDCAGGAIGVGYMNSDFSIRAFKVSLNGNLGEVISSLENSSEGLNLMETTLYQNFPNPFNSTTIIQFHLPKGNEIKIDLYNVLGEKIHTIADAFYHSGMTSIYFASDNLPSGIYLYKLQTEINSLTKKMIIIK